MKSPKVFLLTPGNGHQAANRRKAMDFAVRELNVKPVDEATVSFEPFGECHFAAYTSPAGAMISTPNGEDHNFGDVDWHSKDHIMMLRDLLDGRVTAYVSDIRPLFERRTIGHHGVSWDDVSRLAKYKVIWKIEPGGRVVKKNEVRRSA